MCKEEASVLSQYFNISLQVQYISVHSREHKTPLKNQTSVLECRVMFYVTPVCMCKEKKLLALSKIIIYIYIYIYICYTLIVQIIVTLNNCDGFILFALGDTQKYSI